MKLIALTLFSVVCTVSFQEDDFVRCTRCKNVGARPCGEHEKEECELEHNVLYCSAIGLCETCGGELKKLLSAPAFQFKGSGWYVTDYAKKSGGPKDDGKDGGEKKTEKTEKTKAASSDTKSSPPPSKT